MLLKNADIITISIGMNELYYKLSINNENIYTYMNDMINDLEVLFSLINRYNHKKVFVINYYNVNNYNKDIFCIYGSEEFELQYGTDPIGCFYVTHDDDVHIHCHI